MRDRSELREVLALIDTVIEARETELEELRTARRHLLAVAGPQQTLPTLEPVVASHARNRANEIIHAQVQTGPLRIPAGLSIPEAAERVLAHEYRAMDAEEIARAMVAGGHKYAGTIPKLAATIRGVLGRDIRSKPNSTFIRAARGQYALRRWPGNVTLQLDREDQESETA